MRSLGWWCVKTCAPWETRQRCTSRRGQLAECFETMAPLRGSFQKNEKCEARYKLRILKIRLRQQQTAALTTVLPDPATSDCQIGDNLFLTAHHAGQNDGIAFGCGIKAFGGEGADQIIGNQQRGLFL